MIPMGNSPGQFDIKKVKTEIKSLSSIKKLALYHLLTLSIKVREISFGKYSKDDIYNCMNITPCDTYVNILKRENRLTTDLYSKLRTKYALMVQKSIKTYFSLLKKGEYTIAKDYITKDNVNINIGKSKMSKSKTKTKRKSKKSRKSKSKSKNIKKNLCLKNLLYKSKSIIGHLLIFIEIYKCIDIIKNTI